jgi:hypothetical protein
MARVTVSRLIHAPQADVWAVVSDIANARNWNKSWRKIEFTSPQTHGIGTSFRASMAATLTCTVRGVRLVRLTVSCLSVHGEDEGNY